MISVSVWAKRLLDFSVFLDKDLDHVGEEAIEFRILALALGDGIHFPALVDELGKEVVRFVFPR